MKNPLMPFLTIAVLGIILIVVLSTVGVNQNAEGEGATEAATPEEIFAQNCAMCHGQNLEGASGPNLQQIGSKYSVDEIKGVIQNPPSAAMPPNLVSGEELDVLAEWLGEQK
ncbi:c-type cytochrome [Aureibacillus halotolerans]|uniref:Cytochrome c550 n=1 Tax=Aureibacillus halotolerans TaxID=1508390 RepID=A0A4R6U7Q6_9BACI|nr:cytochrome c [Aureibacillus halotolerans]TDQ41722.1 cytochrome c550 [Aureibacillus halotolerans]